MRLVYVCKLKMKPEMNEPPEKTMQRLTGILDDIGMEYEEIETWLEGEDGNGSVQGPDSVSGDGQSEEKPEVPGVTKPIPKDNPIRFAEDAGMNARIFDVYMHYKGYHDPNMGEWLSLYASDVDEARVKASCVVTKKTSEAMLVQRRRR